MKPAHIPDRGFAPRWMRLDSVLFHTGLRRTKFLELVADGRLPKGKLVDGCRLWDRYQVDEAIEALPDEDGGAAESNGWGAVA